MKNILQIQFSTKSAGSSAIRLHEQLLKIPGYSSEIISLMRDEEPMHGIKYLPNWNSFKSTINNEIENYYFRYDKSKYGMFSNPFIGSSVINHSSFKKASIVYIHWVQMGFLTLNEIEKIVLSGKKIVFVLHDMWGITGGCHIDLNCNHYKEDCADCPILPEQGSFPMKQLAKKKLIYGHKNVSFISPSKWLAKCVEESSVGKEREVKYIPNFFDSPYFKPDSDHSERKDLIFEKSVKIISFAAVNIDSFYKGFDFLLKALEYLPSIYKEENLEIHVIGEKSQELLASIPYPIKYLGYLNSEEKMAKNLSVSDVFVIPSTADNQPTIVIESLSCGVPVVGFKVGGIPDMISHLENGYLAEVGDFKGLAKGIKFCLENKLKGFKLPDFQPEYVLSQHLKYIDSL